MFTQAYECAEARGPSEAGLRRIGPREPLGAPKLEDVQVQPEEVLFQLNGDELCWERDRCGGCFGGYV